MMLKPRESLTTYAFIPHTGMCSDAKEDLERCPQAIAKPKVEATDELGDAFANLLPKGGEQSYEHNSSNDGLDAYGMTREEAKKLDNSEYYSDYYSDYNDPEPRSFSDFEDPEPMAGTGSGGEEL